MPLRKMSFREIRGRPMRTLLTLLSIVIGSGAIVSTYLASTSATLAQIAMVQAVTGNAALEIQAVAGAPFDQTVTDEVAKIPGVAIASPVLRRFSQMTVKPPKEPAPETSSEGTEAESETKELGPSRLEIEPSVPEEKRAAGPTEFRVQLLGVLPELDKKVRGYSLVAGVDLEDAPKGKSAVLMDAEFARASRVTVGTEVVFLTRSFLRRATVVGLVKAGDASAALQSGLIVAPLSVVQKWCKAGPKVDTIQIVLEPQAKLERVKSGIEAQLPQGINVRQPTLRSQVAGESTLAMQQGLGLATFFALLISTFIIYNTFQMNVGERRRQLGILRALGATRSQLLWMIVREGIWVGLIGSALGCLLGNLGASILNMSTARLLQIVIPPSPFTLWPYMIATLCGLVVAIAGAFFPALRASLLSPSEAMKVVAKGEFGSSKLAWIRLGSVLLAIGFSLQFAAIRGWIDIGASVTGAMFIVGGFIFMLPACVDRLTGWIVRLLGPFLKTEGKLARRQILRHRERSSLTIGIVYLAMSTGLGMACVILDNIRNVEDWYQRAVIGDFFVRAAMPDMNSGQAADMPDGLTETIAAMPEVELVDTLRFVSARSNDYSVVVVVRKFNSMTQDYFALTEGDEATVMSGVRRGEVVLGSVLSQRLNLHAGDSIPLETNDGSSNLKVVGVTNEYVAGGLTLYLDAEHAKKLLNVEGTDVIVVKAKRNELGRAEVKLRKLSEQSGLIFQSYSDLVIVIRKTLNGVVGGLWVILAGCSVIAAFGLINTLGMNILEQTREIGMLRVVAMTRSQVRKMVLAQALIMGIIGIVPGVFTAVWIAYMINLSTLSVTGHAVKFQFHPWLMIGGLTVELFVVVIAAMIPAERAARLNVSSALQYE